MGTKKKGWFAKKREAMDEERLLRNHKIEVVSVCLKCHERWCTLMECSKVTKCDACGNEERAFWNYFCSYEGVIEHLKTLEVKRLHKRHKHKWIPERQGYDTIWICEVEGCMAKPRYNKISRGI